MISAYRSTIEHYDRLSVRYQRRWYRYTQRTTREALHALRQVEGTDILNVGCGPGELERQILREKPGLRVIGVDLSHRMVKLAARRQPESTHARFLVGDGETLPFGDSSFDMVLSCNMLHHVRAPMTFLRECLRVLRTEGSLIVVDWCRDFLHCQLAHYWYRATDRTYVNTYRRDELIRLAESVGLTRRAAARFVAPPWFGMMQITMGKDTDRNR